MAKVDPFGLFPSAVRQTLNKSSSFCLKIPCSHYWSLQHRNSVIPASLPLQPLVLQVINTPGGSTGSAAALAGLGIQDPTSGIWDRLAKPLGLCWGMRRALEPVRATQGSQRALSSPGPCGAEFRGAEGQGLEIMMLPGTALPQQSHSVPTGHPKPGTAGGRGSKDPLESQSPMLVRLVPEFCTLVLPQLVLCAWEGAK